MFGLKKRARNEAQPVRLLPQAAIPARRAKVPTRQRSTEGSKKRLPVPSNSLKRSGEFDPHGFDDILGWNPTSVSTDGAIYFNIDRIRKRAREPARANLGCRNTLDGSAGVYFTGAF